VHLDSDLALDFWSVALFLTHNTNTNTQLSVLAFVKSHELKAPSCRTH